jgi:hypothetical protein
MNRRTERIAIILGLLEVLFAVVVDRIAYVLGARA